MHLQNTHRSLGFLTALLATLRNSIWKIFYISNMLLIAIQSHKFIVRTEEECIFCSVITAKSLRYKLLQIFLHTGWFCRLALTDRWYAAYWDKHQSNTQTLSAKPWKNQYLHLLEMIRIIRRWIDRSVSGPFGHLFVVCVSSKSYASLSSPAGDLAYSSSWPLLASLLLTHGSHPDNGLWAVMVARWWLLLQGFIYLKKTNKPLSSDLFYF